MSMPGRTTTQTITEQEISVPNRTILGEIIPKVHTRQRKILGSKLVRRVIPTNIKSIGRPPLNHLINKIVWKVRAIRKCHLT